MVYRAECRRGCPKCFVRPCVLFPPAILSVYGRIEVWITDMQLVRADADDRTWEKRTSSVSGYQPNTKNQRLVSSPAESVRRHVMDIQSEAETCAFYAPAVTCRCAESANYATWHALTILFMQLGYLEGILAVLDDIVVRLVPP